MTVLLGRIQSVRKETFGGAGAAVSPPLAPATAESEVPGPTAGPRFCASRYTAKRGS
jgi:hypothetical protein